ncbi:MULTISPECIES: YiiX/YebB-like N1pC/P60 family cysteine hydrolase [unclassified Leptolyngbya]|nr:MULTISPECIES: YiiX/YebB-like N1pC/P60 family cysteine hydrolase [unclassified Leptolyngbya]MBD1912881.1 hypothetical protein [Leptolyngbya sp. FACHB-8]MBD2154790.1 hypothetical protein [Leptolyngbya sp. FACHB-16]
MTDSFTPQPGDLLFQQKDMSPIHRVISQAFRGYRGYSFNHVALCIDEQRVVEATTPTVQYTDISVFLNSSSKDTYERPRVWVFRLTPAYRYLIRGAIAHAQTLLGLPYNRDFGDRKDSYYCSELILDSFRYANQGIPLFPETPMNFKDPATGEFFEYWVNHYRQLKKPIPHGKPGSHPSLLTLSDKLDPIHLYGELLP